MVQSQAYTKMPLWHANWTAVQTIFLSTVGTWTITCARYWKEEGSDGYSTGTKGAYVCPKCLKQWAVRMWEGDECPGVNPAWCERCQPKDGWNGSKLLVPGSLLNGYNLDYPLLEALPLELLRREVKLHLKRMEN